MAETASGDELTGREVSNWRSREDEERSCEDFALVAGFAPDEPCLLCLRIVTLRGF